MRQPLYLVSLLCLSTGGACQTRPTESPVKLVGGDATTQEDYSSVLIWTTADAEITQTYCTGTKIRRDLLLTAAHCVLEQTPDQGQIYLGPWHRPQSMRPGRRLKYSFSQSLAKTNAVIESLKILEVFLPAQVEECLADAQSPDPLCRYRTPLADVALIRVESEVGSGFESAPAASLNTKKVRSGADVILCGYGSEGKDSVRLPRLKAGEGAVATRAELVAALAHTEAERDGFPSGDYFFGVVSQVNQQHHVNLGSGDSGGPVFLKATGEIVGTNSDGFCPLAELDCQLTNNSVFARIHKGSTGGIGEWLAGIVHGTP